MTDEEKTLIVAEVLAEIQSASKSPEEFTEVSSIDDLTTLPALKASTDGSYALVRVAVSLLKGTDGKSVTLRVQDDYIQYQMGSDDWVNLIAIEALKGDAFTYSDFTDEQIEGLQQPATEAAATANTAAARAEAQADNPPRIVDGVWEIYDVDSEDYVATTSTALGKSPYILSGTWWTYNDNTGEYENTTISASSDYELTADKIAVVLGGDAATEDYVDEALQNIEGETITTSGDITSGGRVLANGDIKSETGNIFTSDGNVYTSDGDIYTTEGDIYTVDGDFVARNGSYYKGSGDDKVEVLYEDELENLATKDYVDTELETKLDKDDVDLENLLAYGVQFDTTISSPTCTRIGNMALHRTLPIQSSMRGCLLNDDGDINSYLPSNDWSDATLDGSAGQVMVRIRDHYQRFKAYNSAGELWDWALNDYGGDATAQGYTIKQVWFSEHNLTGYTPVKEMFVSAYEASLNRTTLTLASVVNSTADYRGGNNNTAYDGTYRSFLGRPATNISLTNFRTYARKRKSTTTEWNCMTYEAQKTIFWLFVVEYATLNSQSAVNAELTSEGYRQGGLGDGPTTLSTTNWSNFNGNSSFIPCGHTNTLGNGTGEVLYEVYDEGNDITISTYANRYRGLENPFGHIWKYVDGILVDVRTDNYDGNYAGQSRVLVAPDPANFASHSTLADTYDGYEFRGLQARSSNSYIKEIIFGEYGDMMGEVVDGSSTTYFCDCNNTSVTSSSIRGVLFGGYSDLGSYTGLASSSSNYAHSITSSIFGSRLCFHPAN